MPGREEQAVTDKPWELMLVLLLSATVFFRSGISWPIFSGKACKMQDMTSDNYTSALDELDRLINDPDVPMQPELIWCLLDKVVKWEKQCNMAEYVSLKFLKEDLPLANATEEQAIRFRYQQ